MRKGYQVGKAILTRIALALGALLLGVHALHGPTRVLAQGDPESGNPAAVADEELLGGVPRSFLERPIARDEALTPVPHAARTSRPAALAYYQQGLSYHYLYHHLNAARSFHQALRLDPGLLPAYAGLSRALAALGARSEAEAVIVRALEAAVERAEAADPLALLLLELRSRALSTADDEDRRAYGEALARALDRNPADAEIHMLWALSARGEERIDRLHQVLERIPNHVGAHHQLIHSYETSGRSEKAVEHGAILAELAPTVAHGRHMFGHNLMRTGRVDEARREFAVADSLERAYFAREGIPEHYDWHHPHNLHLLALTTWHQGRVEEAERILRRRAELEGRQGARHPSRLVQLGELLVAEGRASEARAVGRHILEEAASENGSAGLRAQARLLEAEAFLLTGELEEARAAFAAAEELHGGGRRGPFGVGRWITRVEAQIQVHAGLMDAESDGLAEVLETLRRDRGPDGWITSLLHLHAFARSARAASADRVVDRVVEAIEEHDPTFRGRSLRATGPR